MQSHRGDVLGALHVESFNNQTPMLNTSENREFCYLQCGRACAIVVEHWDQKAQVLCLCQSSPNALGCRRVEKAKPLPDPMGQQCPFHGRSRKNTGQVSVRLGKVPSQSPKLLKR